MSEHRCDPQALAYAHEYYLKNKRRILEYSKVHGRIYRQRNRKKVSRRHHLYKVKVKDEVFAHYSPNRKCQRCQFADIRALSIDHIDGNGRLHRKLLGQNFYRWLRKNNYPLGYQVLCMNCQFIKAEENKERYVSAY